MVDVAAAPCYLMLSQLLKSLLTSMTDTKYRLYCESVKIRDLDGRGPWAVASERSEDATKGPRLSKSRIFIGRAV